MKTDFEALLQDLYVRILRAGDVCIDVGAHSGRHTAPMAAVVGAFGKVYAFEPIPDIRVFLKSRLFHSSLLERVEIFPYALANYSGVVDFVFAVDRPEESGLRERGFYNGPTRTEKISVDVRRLDDLHIIESIRFIKIDCEGAEYLVLDGARDLIIKNRPIVAFEFGANAAATYRISPSDVYDYFTKIGYGVSDILLNSLDASGSEASSRAGRVWDYVACPRELSDLVFGGQLAR